MLGREGGLEQALGGLNPEAGHDPALSPPAVDKNVIPHPYILLMILLNVSLNTLPVLAFRVIYQVLRPLRLKVRMAGVPTAPCWKQGLQGDVEVGLWIWKPRCTPSAFMGRRGQVIGSGTPERKPYFLIPALTLSDFHHELSGTWGLR